MQRGPSADAGPQKTKIGGGGGPPFSQKSAFLRFPAVRRNSRSQRGAARGQVRRIAIAVGEWLLVARSGRLGVDGGRSNPCVALCDLNGLRHTGDRRFRVQRRLQLPRCC